MKVDLAKLLKYCISGELNNMEIKYATMHSRSSAGESIRKDYVCIDAITYPIDSVHDHLEAITGAITSGLRDFARGGAVALDFSNLRKRGAATSHEGVSTGAASFVKTFAEMIAIMSTQNAEKRYKPVVILSEGHPDFKEYSEIKTDAVVKLSRKDGWEDVREIK